MSCCPAIDMVPPGWDVTNLSEIDYSIKNCRVVFLMFYSDTCGVCRAYRPLYDRVASTYYDKAVFLKVNVARFQRLAASLGVMAVPTTLLVLEGQVAGSFVGFIDEERLEAIVDRALEYVGC